MNVRCVHCGDVWSFSDYYCSRCDSHAVEQTRQKPNTVYRFFKDSALTQEVKESDPEGEFCQKYEIASGKEI